MSKLIYRFNNQSSQYLANNKDILGGKGANLAQMVAIGLPVPPGFTISTKVCEYFYKNNNKLPTKLIKKINQEIKIIEKISKKKFGDSSNPLLVSVRSGAKVSMPGMMDTILNLGLNDRTVIALKKKTSNGRFAKDSYRRFIQMYSNVVLGIESYIFEELIENYKLTKGVIQDTELEENDWDGLIENFKEIVKDKLEKNGLATELYITERVGHASEIAYSLCNRTDIQVMVACGGDGTVHEVSSGLRGSKIPLAIIPAGTGNDVARVHGYSLDDLDNIIDIIINGVDSNIGALRIEA